MISIKNSSVGQTKRCQGYVKKLNRQIELIGHEVKSFNLRENSSNRVIKINLKSLTEPKWQKIILQRHLNPENPTVEPQTKISKLFKNCSTFTQSDFTFKNASLLFGGNQSKIINASLVKNEENQIKLQKKLQILEKSWSKIQAFRLKNEIGSINLNPQTDKRTKNILKRLEKERPMTTGTIRSKIISEAYTNRCQI